MESKPKLVKIEDIDISKLSFKTINKNRTNGINISYLTENTSQIAIQTPRIHFKKEDYMKSLDDDINYVFDFNIPQKEKDFAKTLTNDPSKTIIVEKQSAYSDTEVITQYITCGVTHPTNDEHEPHQPVNQPTYQSTFDKPLYNYGSVNGDEKFDYNQFVKQIINEQSYSETYYDDLFDDEQFVKQIIDKLPNMPYYSSMSNMPSYYNTTYPSYNYYSSQTTQHYIVPPKINSSKDNELINKIKNIKSYVYDDKHLDSDFELECPVCFEDMNYCLELACDHHICRTCVIEMFERHSGDNELLCPLCRDNFNIFSYLKLPDIKKIKLKQLLANKRKQRQKHQKKQFK